MAPGKIGVLTFHRCINYGSYWQARCLVEGLRAAGHDAILLDHVSERVNRAEWRCALSPHLPAPTAWPSTRTLSSREPFSNSQEYNPPWVGRRRLMQLCSTNCDGVFGSDRPRK